MNHDKLLGLTSYLRAVWKEHNGRIVVNASRMQSIFMMHMSSTTWPYVNYSLIKPAYLCHIVLKYKRLYIGLADELRNLGYPLFLPYRIR